jgi:hypothetical protein
MASGTFAYTDGTAALNNIFAEEADHIDKEILGYTLHTSPWIDLSPRAEFASGNGYRQNSLVYDRALPQYQTDGSTGDFDEVGALFVDMSPSALATASKGTGVLANSHVDSRGPIASTARIDFTKKLRDYNLERAVFFGPYLSLEDLRFVTQLQEQVSQMVQIMGDATKFIMEERFRTEYDRVCDNVVACKTSGTVISTGFYDFCTGGIAYSDGSGLFPKTIDWTTNAALLPTANISNRVMDIVQLRLRRSGANQNAWGMENGKAIHAVILSSEASYRLTTESGYRDDLRNAAGRVDELLAPLGVDKAWRGFYHLCDDLAPRYTFTDNGSDDYMLRVQPYSFSSSVLVPNSLYDTAQYEVAHVLHKDVAKHLIPAPTVPVGGGISFNPQDYTGKYNWLNIPDQVTNPFGTNGRFGGIIASATKPMKVDYGYRIIFDRTSATPAE